MGTSSMFNGDIGNTQGHLRMNSDMKNTSPNQLLGTNNSMPIREAKEEQEMSH